MQPPTLVDTHCHLYFDWFDEDREGVIQRAMDAGVRFMVTPAVDLESAEQAIELSRSNAGIYAAVGIHPNECSRCDETSWKSVKELASAPKVVAIGEIGLDYYRDRTDRGVQIAALEKQLEIASSLGLPVILHNRDSEDDLLSILESWCAGDGVPDPPGVWHAFNLSIEWAERIRGLGFYLGIGGVVTFKNARLLRDTVGRLSLDDIVLETDSPFLSPHPYRGKRNEPARVKLIAETIAALQGTTFEEVARRTTENAEKLFGIRM